MALAVPARRSRPLLVGLVLAHLVAISHQVDGGGGLSLLQRGLLGALSPLQSGVRAIVVKKQGDFPPFWEKNESFIED